MVQEGLWSLVSVTHNSSDDLRKYLARQPFPRWVEVVVVDNASTDGSVEAAQQAGARVISHARNLGFAAGNNLGLANVSGEFVAFVNPDVEVDYSSLPHLAQILAERDALVAPQLVYPDGRLQPNGRCLPYLGRKIAHRLPFASGPRLHYDVIPERARLTRVAWTMGAALCARADSFRRLGGWEESFFIYYEDHEIGLRAWANGVEVLLDPRVRWVHGWARETTAMRLKPWMHEAASAARFYGRYPTLLSAHLPQSPLLRAVDRVCGEDVCGEDADDPLDSG